MAASETQPDLQELTEEEKKPKEIKAFKNKPPPETKLFYMPQSLYEETKKEITQLYKKKEKKTYFETILTKCHLNNYQNFTSKCTAMTIPNFVEAINQAYQCRDFKALYRLIEIGFEIDSKALSSHLVEYLLLAIKIDPAIPNREEFFMNVVKGLSKKPSEEFEPSEFIKRFHLLEKHYWKKDLKAKADDDNKSNDEGNQKKLKLS
ncbi:hypothetical protein PVAND_001667 [Polypedilum vanderplanki]|uniref:Uncharacterized protein n=1 Tax=Polypedilum vanderplanki TaxID=319348 RepID=A0A9J6BP31_POLVA|nr:hypothetical protein PVAND_001667 [Polypedilum vanderplanki]